MSIWEKILDGLSEDTWTTGGLGSERYGRCLAGHVLHARTGLDDARLDYIDLECGADLLVLHEIICEQYPEVVDAWLTFNFGGYPLTPYGLVAFFNDRTRYEGVRAVVEKAAAR